MKKAFQDSRHWNTSHLAILVLLSLLCYWPISSGLFSAKNDNITQFLPVRFHVSEALRNGHLPLWTPYMYLGFPMHGDMQGGAWNPLVWLLSLFGRYQITSLHGEILVYIILSGIGMYRLLSTFQHPKNICLAGAGAYLMCGYITDVGGSNLPFLAAAAYIPFVFAYYYQLLTTPAYRHAFKTAAALSLLFVSAYPSFFICTCYVLLAALIAYLLKKNNQQRDVWPKKFLVSQTQVAFMFLLFSAPAIISYAGILPYYQRGSGVSQAGALENNFDPSCMISFIFPSAPIKNPASYATDLISRNSYFNLLLLVFFGCYFFIKKNFLNTFFIAIGIAFFLLFSLGDATPLRTWCYDFVPLMNTFRHPSNARLYVIIGGIVLAMASWQKFLNGELPKKYLLGVSFFIGVFIVTQLIISGSGSSLFARLSNIFTQTNDARSGLKIFSKHSHMEITSWLMELHNFVSFSHFSLLFFFQKANWLPWMIMANSLCLAQLTLPYTFVTKVPPQEINAVFDKVPAGYPNPLETRDLGENQRPPNQANSLLVMDEFYNKMIASPELAVTPTFMKTMKVVYSNVAIKDSIFSKPYAYFDEGKNASFELLKLWNNGFVFSMNAPDTSQFYLQQVLLPGWKAFIDDQRVAIQSYGPGFISLSIPPGNHTTRFVYKPFGLVPSVMLSFLSLLACIVYYKKV